MHETTALPARRLAPRRPVWAMCLWLASTAVWAVDSDEARLRAIREAMVNAALSTTTEVKVSSWMDSGGALHEFNRFSSEVRLREIRMGTNANAAAAVEDRVPQDVAQVSAQVEAVPPAACPAPAAKTALRHVMVPTLALSPTLTPVQRYPAQQVGQQALTALMASASGARQWRAVQTTLPTTLYEQRLQNRGQESTQWQVWLQVELLSEGVGADDMPALSLHWQVRQRGQTKPWLELRDDLPPPRATVNAATPRLDEGQTLAIARSAQHLADALDHQLACEPQTLRLHTDMGRLLVSAGDLSGLRVGDRLVLADGRALPRHALEAGALDAAVLAEVKSVSAYQAELSPVAGKRQVFNPSWVAWPYTY